MDAVEAYRSLRDDAGVLDLRDWRALHLYGADTRDFLQGTASQDLASGGSDTAVETLFLTEKGRPVAHAWVAIADSGADAWIVADPDSAAALRPHLERFRIMEDVEFEGPELAHLIGVAGPNRAARARALGDRTQGSRVLQSTPLSFLQLPHATPPIDVAPPEVAAAWRIAAGVPLAGIDFDLERIATELDLPQAISFTKGCYVGQEVVARTSNRGQVRRRRVGFRFAWPGRAPERGTPIQSGHSRAGFLTSAVVEPGSAEGLGMGYVSVERVEAREPLYLDSVEGHRVPITVASWPL